MIKKLIAACVALAAFVLPPNASAINNPDLTEGGSRVGVGATIVGTATNTEFLTTSGTNVLTCTSAKVSGELTANSGGTVEGTITSAAFSGTGPVTSDNGLGECTGSFGNAYVTVSLPLCIASTPAMADDEFLVTGSVCGAGGPVRFLLGGTTTGGCEYETTSAVSGTYMTGTSPVPLTVRSTPAGSGAKLIKGGFLCSTSGQLKMTFTLETANGTSLSIS